MRLKRRFFNGVFSYFELPFQPAVDDVVEVVVWARGSGPVALKGFFMWDDGWLLALPLDAEDVELLYVDW